MKKLLMATSLAACSLAAVAAPPSDASIEQLLLLTKSEALLDSVYGNLENNMRSTMAQFTAGKELSAEQKRTLELAPKKFAEVMRQDFNWPMLKAVYVKIYKETFDQDDIDGLNAFYIGKVGQSFVTKMPEVMQKSSVAVQQMMVPLMTKLGEAMKAAAAEAKVSN